MIDDGPLGRYRNILVENREGQVVMQHDSLHDTRVDVEDEALAQGWVSKVAGADIGGIYCYLPSFARLLSASKYLIRRLALGLGYEEYVFARHYEETDLGRFGWIGHPELEPQLVGVSALKRDPSVDRTNHCTVGDPVQCLGFYSILRDAQERLGGTLPGELFESGAILAYEDQGGWTLRNEDVERLTKGFGTAFEFSGAELAFAGTEDQVYAARWETLTAVIRLLESMDLSYRLVVSEACSRRTHQESLSGASLPLYEIPTIDVELKVPHYAGSRDPWIEVGGGDVAGDHLTAAYGLTVDHKSTLRSGCQGFGWQRFILAFLSQKGFDDAGWPEPLKALLPPAPEDRIGSTLRRARQP